MTANLHNQADGELLSRVEAFWAAHKETVGSLEKWVAEKAKVQALPECPAFAVPAENREAYEAYLTFMKDHGVQALSNAFKKANKQQGKTVNAVFDTPARTYPGVLAKLKIVEVAYGNGESDGDDELQTWQDGGSWLQNATGDFERLVASASTTKHERPEGGNEPDAELLRLNAEYRTLMGEIDSGKHLDEVGRIIDEASNRSHDLKKKIAGIPAKTYAGIGAKLRIAADGLRPEYPRDLETDELNLESALADAERLAVAASSTVALETTGEDPFEALAAEWAEQKAECERLSKAFVEAWDRLPRWAREDKGVHQCSNRARIKRAMEDAGITELDVQSDAAGERLGEIEQRIAVTPTTTILGIAAKLRAEAFVEVEYEFTTTEHVIKTALAGAEYLLAQSQKAA